MFWGRELRGLFTADGNSNRLARTREKRRGSNNAGQQVQLPGRAGVQGGMMIYWALTAGDGVG